MAVLEWCKLFADKRGKHHWSKVVGETDPFLLALLDYLDITAEAFDSYINSVKHYRDKFVAHLDEKRQMNIPELTTAKSSAIYLFDRVRAENPEALADAPTDLNEFYEKRKAHAKRQYRLAT